jgi:hypothetical protein
MHWMSSSTGTNFTGIPTSLILRIGLALASIVAYGVLALIAEKLEAVDGIPETGLWFHYLVGAVFGALVLAPYIGPRQRVIRFLAMCIASAAIYYLAVRFVIDGPIGYDMITSFILAGSAAALLSGIAVVAIAPRAFSLKFVPLALAAGALGGAVFDLKFSFDPNLLIGHAVWQLLVCLALNFSFRDVPA